MKYTKKYQLLLIVSCLVAAFLTTACSSHRKSVEPFTVEKEVCFLEHVNFWDIDEFDLTVTVDVPVNAPKTLTDSITAFLNERLYEYFDGISESHPSYESVYSSDLAHLAEHYRDAFQPLQPEYSWHDLYLVAQTDTYITYEEVWSFRGEGIHESYEWTTFVKEDGRRLKKVISKTDLERFFEDYPELEGSDMGDYESAISTGLLEDSLAFVYAWGGGHDDIYYYDLHLIKPYLSEEAQKLVSANGIAKRGIVLNELKDILCTVKTSKGETFYLNECNDAIMAYTKTDEGYVPIAVFDNGNGLKRFIHPLKGGWFSSKPDCKSFIFNESNKKLYVPKVRTVVNDEGKDIIPYNDHYDVYQFDGEHFISKGEEVAYWLHPSIQQFESLVYCGKTEEYLLRVDRMDDDTYRLAAWKNKDDMKDAPDILVEGGRKVWKPSDGSMNSTWVFENDTNRFVVKDFVLHHEFQVYDNAGGLYFIQKLERY